jgi:cobalt/nickel transport system permease protein
MATIETAFFNLGYLETLANQHTVVHRLDPRAKLLTTFLFVGIVMSWDRYAISGILPFVIYPLLLMTVGNLPNGYLLKRVGLILPFVVFIGLANPLLDRTIRLQFGPLPIAAGWVSLLAMLLRAALTITAAFTLIATTGWPAICLALERLGVPRIFVLQLLFIYRYLFVLLDEAARLVRARNLRSFAGKGLGVQVWGSLIGHLLLRTIDRARRIHVAMLARGFTGDIRVTRQLHFSGRDWLFLVGWTIVFVLLRRYNVSLLLGNLLIQGRP